MAKVKITETSEGRVMEVSDISFEEAQSLINSNGPGRTHARRNRAHARVTTMPDAGAGPNYAGFMQALSPKGKRLVEILKENRNGINADALTEQMGFKSSSQIGGVTGGGMAKLANRFHLDLSTIYTAEVRFESGTRQTIYKPGSALFLSNTKTA